VVMVALHAAPATLDASSPVRFISNHDGIGR